MMRHFGVAALAPLVFAGSAQAADLATIDCVANKLDKTVSAQIAADVSRNMFESGKKPSYDPMVGAGIATAAQACAGENGWSEAAVKAVRIYTLAKVGLPVAQRVIGERGFDTAVLEEQFLTLPEETRNRVLTAQETQELVRNAVTDEAKQTRENAELVAEYFAFLSTIQYASYEFSQA